MLKNHLIQNGSYQSRFDRSMDETITAGRLAFFQILFPATNLFNFLFLIKRITNLGPQVLDGHELCILLHDSCVGVKVDHGADVLEGVGLPHRPGNLAVGGPQHLADLLGLEQLAQVGVGHLGHGQVPVLLGGRGFAPGAV